MHAPYNPHYIIAFGVVQKLRTLGWAGLPGASRSEWEHLVDNPENGSVEGYIQTFRNTITGTVLAMISRSVEAERWRMYSRSMSTLRRTPSRSVS